MRSRDAPENTARPVEISSTFVEVFSTVQPTKSALPATRSSAPVKSSKAKAKAPKDSRAKRPPNIGGYTWRKDGAGWELRKTIYVDDGTGSKIRKRPYVARMAKAVFSEMKRRHKGAALEKAIAQWIAERDRQEEGYGR